ncbi:RagB/SusD family nutrient uptake outer membrane protein [Mangrovibacterium marinum]|uniref:Putative outer membrane starch-binding protein n=1 Tax=Mangrovibacterium marinum TaxID=1639118 RepID=A0A2T5BZ70_9BACT|nr:RagB/SusD family nutrient uptake outer membrane protein [Mangrovibacterium marinum]PTN07548.1 putative outer membrane starch-binding protein [Mangrovibacterium marinum]
MKNKINHIKLLLILVGGFLMQACSDQFDELTINPNQPSMNAYFTSPESVNTAVQALYGYISTQRCLGASGSKTQIIRSDEAASNSDYGKPGMYGSDLNSSFYTIEQPFTLMYTTASQASFVIEAAPGIDFGTNTELKNAYIGEAHFWRAFAHYYLLINYRNISPIRNMPRNAGDYIRSAEKPEDVWTFIQEDLIKAKELLPGRGFWSSENHGRVTKGAAAALLGKCYLYRSGIETVYGDDKTTFYNEAAREFSDIINGVYGTYSLTANYADNFDVAHENNSESLLEVQFLGDVNNTSFNPGLATSGLAFDSRGLMLPGAGVGYEGVVHNWLYDAFVESVDKDGYTDVRMFSTLVFNDLAPEIKLRQQNGEPVRLTGPGGWKWEELYPEKNGSTGFSTTSNVLAHPFKAGIKKGMDFSMPTLTDADGTPIISGVGSGVKEYVYNQPRAHGVNWRYIRYADVLLMYAEAVLNGGNSQASITPLEAVNQVRSRANLANLPALTLEDVKHERVLELALEGHRYYDLLRWGELAERFNALQNSDSYFKKFVSSSDFQGFVSNKHEWLPIPINEINTNPSINQNPGY